MTLNRGYSTFPGIGTDGKVPHEELQQDREQSSKHTSEAPMNQIPLPVFSIDLKVELPVTASEGCGSKNHI